jgi:hypothetical protein
MKTATAGTTLFIFNQAAPEQLEQMPIDYYRECRLAGAGSVEIEVSDHSAVIISATRYLPADADVAAIVVDGIVHVLCTLVGREPVVMGEFTDWTSYIVRRSAR